MKSRNVFAVLLVLLVVIGIFLKRRWNEPAGREAIDRHPARLTLTRHARCRMDCRHISEADIRAILDHGIINRNKSDYNGRPCPVLAVQGETAAGESLRVIVAQCDSETRVITCYNLHADPECYCPGDERKNQ